MCSERIDICKEQLIKDIISKNYFEKVAILNATVGNLSGTFSNCSVNILKTIISSFVNLFFFLGW